MYTPSEIASVKAVYQNLVFLNLIRIDELDAFGEPVAHYRPEARKQLVALIKECSGFDWLGVLENASRVATTECSGFMVMVSRDGVDKRSMLDRYWSRVEEEIANAAMLELTESLFPKAELNSMLKDHHEYLDMVQDNVRRGLLLAEEMDDSAERVKDQRSAA